MADGEPPVSGTGHNRVRFPVARLNTASVADGELRVLETRYNRVRFSDSRLGLLDSLRKTSFGLFRSNCFGSKPTQPTLVQAPIVVRDSVLDAIPAVPWMEGWVKDSSLTIEDCACAPFV